MPRAVVATKTPTGSVLGVNPSELITKYAKSTRGMNTSKRIAAEREKASGGKSHSMTLKRKYCTQQQDSDSKQKQKDITSPDYVPAFKRFATLIPNKGSGVDISSSTTSSSFSPEEKEEEMKKKKIKRKSPQAAAAGSSLKSPALQLLLEKFASLETVIFFMKSRGGESCCFDVLKKRVENLLRKEFNKEDFANIVHIFPTAYDFVTKLNDAGSFIVDLPDMTLSKSRTIQERKNEFMRRLHRLEAEKGGELKEYVIPAEERASNKILQLFEAQKEEAAARQEQRNGKETGLRLLSQPRVMSENVRRAMEKAAARNSAKIESLDRMDMGGEGLKKAKEVNEEVNEKENDENMCQPQHINNGGGVTTPYHETKKKKRESGRPARSQHSSGITESLRARIMEKERRKLQQELSFPLQELKEAVRKDSLFQFASKVISLFNVMRKGAMKKEVCIEYLQRGSNSSHMPANVIESAFSDLAKAVPEWFKIIPVNESVYIKLSPKFNTDTIKAKIQQYLDQSLCEE
eukprot:Nk52_evm37s158 gene=Nk52_evmTU37s158